MFIFFIMLRCAINGIVDPLIRYPFPTDTKKKRNGRNENENHRNNKDSVNFIFLVVLICLSYSMQTMHYIASTVPFSCYTHTQSASPWSNLLVFPFIFMRCSLSSVYRVNAACRCVCVYRRLYVYIYHAHARLASILCEYKAICNMVMHHDHIRRCACASR